MPLRQAMTTQRHMSVTDCTEEAPVFYAGAFMPAKKVEIQNLE